MQPEAQQKKPAGEGQEQGTDNADAQEQWDDEELALQEDYGLEAAQLRWRRWCISANCGGDPDRFTQEYPALADEAFLASGRPVFASRALAKAYAAAKEPVAVSYTHL